MKSRYMVILFVLCISYYLIYSDTYEIKQDNTGDFTTIQAGIDLCTASDTILVYPGTYYENLVFLNKRITLGSLYLTTGDETYIHQTILDGYQNSSVIRIEDTSSYQAMQIVGFIIQNGNGYQYNAPFEPKTSGGGLYVSNSALSIKNCLIQNNTSITSGGGITLSHSNLILSGSTVRFNHCDNGAGGILIGGQDSNVIFDEDNLNNIYMNYSGYGNDIFISQSSPFQEIIVDTFTVIYPDENYYYIYPGSGGAGIPSPDKFSINIQHGYLEQVNQDLYISENGNDNNSGLTENDPLRSISYALIKMRSDSLQQRTIHIADGTYSASQNTQMFPLHIKSYIDIVGESRDGTILDREQEGGFFLGYDGQKNYQIRNLSLVNGRDLGNLRLSMNSEAYIDNIYVSGYTDDWNSSLCYGSFVFNFSDVTCNGILSENNQEGCSIYYYSPNETTKFEISNSIFRNNQPPQYNEANMQIWCYRSMTLEDSLCVNIINTQITDNVNELSESIWFPAVSGIFIDWQTKLNLINSTIGNNSCLNIGAAIKLEFESEANIINSIIYGNTPYNICLDSSNGANTLNTRNSLIQNGTAGFLQVGANYIHWDENTMQESDPLWQADGDYMLSVDSPCIDNGTLELPEGVQLPVYDLAGNPRVMGDSIDMGAFEYVSDAAPINLQIDNATLSWQMPSGFTASAYNIYLDDQLQITVNFLQNSYTFPRLLSGNSYTAAVSAVYELQETAAIPLQFIYQPVSTDEQDIPITTQPDYLLTNYPNPFNPSTTFSFIIPETGNVDLTIYNIKGQKVLTIISATLIKGEYKTSWNGRDKTGKQVSSGEYIARLDIDNLEKAEHKILLLK